MAWVVLALTLAGCAGNGGSARSRDGLLAVGHTTAFPRAAFFEDKMGVDHLDRLVAAGFNQALIHTIDHEPDAFAPWAERGDKLGIETVPILWLQVPKRQSADGRRYVWASRNDGLIYADVIACPVDSSLWWRSFHERADTLLARYTDHINLDMELYFGKRNESELNMHYTVAPCQCTWCRSEFESLAEPGESMQAFQLRCMSGFLTRMFSDLRARHPDFVMSVLDLDFDSDVHRAIAAGLRNSGVPTANYSERSMFRERRGWSPASALREAKDVMPDVPLVGGLWLRHYRPDEIGQGIDSILEEADGFFIFSTYSLWEPDAEKRVGAWALEGSQDDYWRALERIARH